MGRGIRQAVAPGIVGLFAFVIEHEGAIEADLIDKGQRLRRIGVDDFTNDDLEVIIRHSQRTSELFKKLHPAEALWSHTDHLLALIYDKLAEHNWMISEDGRKRVRRPKPLPRPGIQSDDETKHYRGKPIPMDQMAAKVAREYGHLHAVPDGPQERRGKLTAEQAIAIRALSAAGQFTREEIALSYEVSPSTIGRIVRRETWGDLPETA